MVALIPIQTLFPMVGTPLRAAIFLTDCNALMDIDILSDPSGGVNGNAVRVPEIQPTADVAVYGKVNQMGIAG